MAAGLQRTKHPVAIAAAEAHTQHLHMPMVAGAVARIQLDDLLGLAGGAGGEQQQLYPGRQGRHHRKIDACLGDAGAKGRGMADPDRRQRALVWLGAKLGLLPANLSR